MEEQLITFETAKLTKEKGFNIPTYTSYIGGIFHENEDEPNGYDGYDLASKEDWNKEGWVFSKDGGSCLGCKLDNIKYFEAYTVPTQSLLQRWLREVHKIDVQPICTYKQIRFYHLGIIFINGKNQVDTIILKDEDMPTNKLFNSYEEALEAGLREALKIVK